MLSAYAATLCAVWCYAMCLCYAPMRCAYACQHSRRTLPACYQLKVPPPTLLRVCYALPGIDIGYGTTRRRVSGTDVGYAGTRPLTASESLKPSSPPSRKEEGVGGGRRG
eukprot:2781200-Rhodomonas_salina.1